MDQLKELMSLCKCSLEISINDHRDVYEDVDEYLSNYHFQGDKIDIEKEILYEMIETNTIINIIVYPSTPIGFYNVFHYDLEKALDLVINAIKER